MATAPPVDRLFELAACALLTTDANGMVVHANAVLHTWLGMEPGSLAGKTRVTELMTIGARLFHHTRCLPLLQLGAAVSEVQLELRTRDGSRLPVLLNIVRQRETAADGETAIELDHWAVFKSSERHAYEQALLVARKTAEEALEAHRLADQQLQKVNVQLSEADRRKDEFLATLSHELRNPLAPMRSALDILKLKYGQEKDAALLQAFDRQLRHLTRLVDDLMEVSRITQNRMQLQRMPVDLGALVLGAAHDLRALMEASRHQLHVSVPQPPLVVDGDATRLTQVVINLLTNAAKYTPEGGRIDLALECVDRHAELRVRDNGIGIPKDALGTVFQMFSQLEPALVRARGGLGIGLALAHGIVELHGGQIQVASDGPGHGSEFTLRLPLVEASAWNEETPVRNSLPTARRVLVVDDNVDAAETLAMALDLFGCTTRLAHTADSALTEAQTFAPDVALLDIGLPDFNGYELARRLRGTARGAGMMLIAATGWGQDKDRQLAFDAGFDHHLTKPIDVERLLCLLQQDVIGTEKARP